MLPVLDDIRYAGRTLRRNPVLTAVAVLSLGIGIGANTAIFTLLDGMLLRALPVSEPDRLVLLASPGGWNGAVDTNYNDDLTFSWPKYVSLRQHAAPVMDGLLARDLFPAAISTSTESDNAGGELVSGNYFDLLGVRPALGRLFQEEDTRVRSGAPVAVLSYGYWMNPFGGSPSVLNQGITVNGHLLTIVGVSGRGFRTVGAGESPAVFVPITMTTEMRPAWTGFDNPHAYSLNIFGRLARGVSPMQAQAALAPAWRGILLSDVASLPARLHDRYVSHVLEVRPGGNGISSVRGNFELPLYLMMAMVGLVLLIACANVASLLLGRAAASAKEIAIRLSLGASRARLMRPLLAESLLLSVSGGLLGLLMTSWTASLLLRLIPAAIPTAGLEGAADSRILAFTAAVSIVSGLLFGLAPAVRGTRVDPAAALKEQGGAPSSGAHARFRQVLVAGQIAVSVLLLAAAGLFARSLYNLRTLNPGFRADHLETFSLNPRLNGYAPDRSIRLYFDLQRKLETAPGVTGASMAKWALLTNSVNLGAYQIEGFQTDDPRGYITVSDNQVGPRFFGVLGVPLLAGRDFSEADSAQSAPVAIINEAAARKFFAGRNPIGRHVARARTSISAEIVGVVRDIKSDDLHEQPKPFIYRPAAQDPSPGPMTFYARTRLTGEAFAASLRPLVRGLDAGLPVTGPQPIAEQVNAAIFLDRMVAALSAAFAIVATLLAAIGLYGVIAWAVARRRREIGIRMALGAAPAEVLRMVLTEVLALASLGLAAAVPLWFAAARALKSLLFGVAAFDALTLAAAVAVLTLAATLAGLIPAFRASRIAPILAIRE